jgi:hypothetical protein
MDRRMLPLPIHDVLEVALLVVMTIFSIGRWAQARELKEQASVDTAADVRDTFDTYCRTHAGEHEMLWNEIERNRKHWHEEATPRLQAMAERIARLDEHERAQDGQFDQLWAQHHDQRRPPSGNR